jgi:membrane-associated phospholipid phosphatase
VSPQLRNRALALAAAFAALAALVATGAVNGIDQWSIDHLMPGLPGNRPGPSNAEAVVPLLHSSWTTALDVVANIVTLPAQVVIASVLAAVCCVVLARRGEGRDALVWAGAWVLGNALEVLGKSTLTRPALHKQAHTVTAFGSSFPSGHTLRSVLLVAIVAAAWPSARTWLVAWAGATLVLLELDGFHVPSDIVGGLLLALLLITAARAALRKAG